MTPGTYVLQWWATSDSLVENGAAEVHFTLDYEELSCEPLQDADGDALCDLWERYGMRLPDGTFVSRERIFDVDGNGKLDPVEIPSTDTRDLYVEFDVAAQYKERAAHLHDVALAFRDRPDPPEKVLLRIDTSETFAQTGALEFAAARNNPLDSLQTYRYGLVGDEFARVKEEHFGPPGLRALPGWAAVREARARVYRYGLGVDQVAEGPNRPTGSAETGGNDFVVGLGDFDRQEAVAHLYNVRGFTAAAFMHELGHTLGLRHGGGDDLLCKPNYVSVMNYPYAFLASIDLGVLRDHRGIGVGPQPLDYSHEALPPLDEARLVEQSGLGVGGTQATPLPVWLRNRWIIHGPDQPRAAGGREARFAPIGAQSIDWNSNGVTDALVQNLPLRRIQVGALRPACIDDGQPRVLTSYDDWANLRFEFTPD
jgi:hypothetical protein